MKNIGVGVLVGFLLASGYYFLVLKPKQEITESTFIEDKAKFTKSIDSLITIAITKDSLSVESEKRAIKYEDKEKEALRKADLEHKKYLLLKNSIPHTLADCIDRAEEVEGHLINEIVDLRVANRECDSAKISYKAALKECREIPSVIDTEKLITDLNKAFDKELQTKDNIIEQKTRELTTAKIWGWVKTILALALGFAI